MAAPSSQKIEPDLDYLTNLARSIKKDLNNLSQKPNYKNQKGDLLHIILNDIANNRFDEQKYLLSKRIGWYIKNSKEDETTALMNYKTNYDNVRKLQAIEHPSSSNFNGDLNDYHNPNYRILDENIENDYDKKVHDEKYLPNIRRKKYENTFSKSHGKSLNRVNNPPINILPMDFHVYPPIDIWPNSFSNLKSTRYISDTCPSNVILKHNDTESAKQYVNLHQEKQFNIDILPEMKPSTYNLPFHKSTHNKDDEFHIPNKFDGKNPDKSFHRFSSARRIGMTLLADDTCASSKEETSDSQVDETSLHNDQEEHSRNPNVFFETHFDVTRFVDRLEQQLNEALKSSENRNLMKHFLTDSTRQSEVEKDNFSTQKPHSSTQGLDCKVSSIPHIMNDSDTRYPLKEGEVANYVDNDRHSKNKTRNKPILKDVKIDTSDLFTKPIIPNEKERLPNNLIEKEIRSPTKEVIFDEDSASLPTYDKALNDKNKGSSRKNSDISLKLSTKSTACQTTDFSPIFISPVEDEAKSSESVDLVRKDSFSNMPKENGQHSVHIKPAETASHHENLESRSRLELEISDTGMNHDSSENSDQNKPDDSVLKFGRFELHTESEESISSLIQDESDPIHNTESSLEDEIASSSLLSPKEAVNYSLHSEKATQVSRDLCSTSEEQSNPVLSIDPSLSNLYVINASDSISTGELPVPSIEIGDVTISEGELAFEASFCGITPGNNISIRLSTKDGVLQDLLSQSSSSSRVCDNSVFTDDKAIQTSYEPQDLTEPNTISEGEVLDDVSSTAPNQELLILKKENEALRSRLSSFSGRFIRTSH